MLPQVLRRNINNINKISNVQTKVNYHKKHGEGKLRGLFGSIVKEIVQIPVCSNAGNSSIRNISHNSIDLHTARYLTSNHEKTKSQKIVKLIHTNVPGANQLIKPNNVEDNKNNAVRSADEAVSNQNATEKSVQFNPDPNKHCSMRTHTCGELGKSHIGQNVKLVGWIEFLRMDKFILLRDRYGRIQLYIPESNTQLQKLLLEVPLETVILVEGTVTARPPGQENPKQKTGYVEVSVTDMKILNTAKNSLPFCVREFNRPLEHTRLIYRYLDLRHEFMQRNLRLRSEVAHKMRKYLIEHLDFLEVETPTLFKRTPGGAQEFVVPTENKGKFYALVQSPQQFKQLLMVGSADRYFQFAHCFRDEAIRGDRQPEFTQLDLEMSFCNREDILNIIEELMVYCWPESAPSITTPFPKMTYEEAMNSYGTDKPDLRFDWKIENLSSLLKEHKDDCNGKINVKNLENDFSAHAFVARGAGVKFTNAVKKKLLDEIKILHPSMNFYFLSVKSLEKTKKDLESLFCKTVAEGIEKITRFKEGDVLFMTLGHREEALISLGRIRVNFAEYLEEQNVSVIEKDSFRFVWVLDFPLFSMKDGNVVSNHHPFTQPHPDDLPQLESEPLKVRGLHYDLVLNGNEIGGGSIRVHDSKLQRLILEKILSIDPTSLSHLLDALDSGAPPHGGIALGFDRLIAILCNAETIRDVIAFPKGSSGQDHMSGAPCDISEEEKKRYHL